jgi:zinc transport system ATP-binding protein
MTHTPVPLLQLEKVSVSVGPQEILRDIDLDVLPGEILTLIGPNGAGKTTLVRIVLGLMAFTGKRQLRPGLRIGYMPQKLELNPQLPLTVKRFLQLSGANDKQIHEHARETGVEKIFSYPVQSISGGELQRVLLTRALLNQPDLLVLDEPAQGVDVHGQAEMYRLIHQIKSDRDCGVLMVSHDLHWVMAQTDKVVCLNQHICCHGHPDLISHDPAFVALFGQEISKSLAPYTHHHDHDHDLHGNVLQKSLPLDEHVHDEHCTHSHSLLRPPTS